MILEIVQAARQAKCSDVHLTVGKPCVFRSNGRLIPAPFELSAEDTQRAILSLCSEEQLARLEHGEDLDFAFALPGGERQRANIYRQQGNLAAAIRLLNDTVPTLEALHLPDAVRKLANEPRGLILVTGPTGSGKSTTLAAMIDLINRTKPVHILTVEDPVEYLYKDHLATIHQREVGRDVGSFSGALRSALREDPDVILVGEMRDFETISSAVTAAETGHLVLSTLHTNGAAQTVDRIVDVCPPEAQQQMRVQLSTVLKGVVTQALLPLASGAGRIVATEILLGTDAVLNLIREKKSYQLATCMQSGAAFGMHTFDADLTQLCRRGLITRETAAEWAFAPRDLLL